PLRARSCGGRGVSAQRAVRPDRGQHRARGGLSRSRANAAIEHLFPRIARSSRRARRQLCYASFARRTAGQPETTRGATVRPNRIKQLWREGTCVTLGWLSVPNGFTAEVMARQGFDALCVDMQHGLTDFGDLWPMLQAISQTDTVPVVRVPWNDP